MSRLKANANGMAGFKAVLVTILALTTGSAIAEPGRDSFNMIVISNQAFGAALIAGNYGAAINSLAGKNKPRRESFAASNNLCVAYVKAGNTEQAELACDAAVKKSRLKPREDRAIALSNRGVLRALAGDPFGALYDLQAATRLETRARVAGQNLGRLHSRITSPDFLVAD